MASDTTQDNRLLRFVPSRQTGLDKDDLLISRLTVSESLSALFNCHVELVAEEAKAHSALAEALIGKKVTIEVALTEAQDAGPQRYFNGIVSRFSQRHEDERFVHYQAEVVPWLWLLRLTSDCRIFQDKTVPEIINQVFNDLKTAYPDLVAYRDETTSGRYTKVDYCVQYRETDFQFVSRLMEQEGIFYFFEQDREKHTLVLADSPAAHKPCPDQPEARFLPVRGRGRDEDVITDWRIEYEMRPGKYTLRDYHFQIPSKTLEVNEFTTIHVGDNAPLEVYDYPGAYAQRFTEPDRRLEQIETEARKVVRLRMEEEEVPHAVIRGASSCRPFATGYHFDRILADGRRDPNGPYVLLGIQHVAVQSPYYVSESISGEPYYNSFTCISHAVPFRPSQLTPKPVIQGMQTAVVVGKPGEEIWTDKYGRVKVQFHWDRQGKRDDNSSCWIRVGTIWAGKQWGAIHIPRVGQEVIVDFLEGDPDRPIIVGSVYNAEHMPPYELPAHQTQSGLKSRSSKSGTPEDFNEIRFEDKKGQEEVYVHAERNLRTVVESNESRRVGYDRTTTVGHDDTKTVRHDQTLTVQNNRTATMAMDDTETIGNNQTVTVGMNQATLIGASLSITCGAGATVTVGAATTITSGGPVTITAPLITLNASAVMISGALIASSVVSPVYTPGLGNLI